MELAGAIMMTFVTFIMKLFNKIKNTEQTAALDNQGGAALAI